VPIQTTYLQTIAPAYEGMIADSRDQSVISMQVETAGGIGFGKVAVQGTADKQIRVSAAGRAFRGITVATHFAGFTAGTAGTKDAYDQYETAPVLEKGPIWVMASVAVAVGDPVYYVPATGVLTNVATANTLVPNAIWESSTTGAGLAIVNLK
jgi:hypothetical protein